MNTWISVVTHSIQSSQLAAGFLDLLLKSFLVLFAAGGVCLCWRRAAASARHLVWLLAVVGLLCLPGLSRLVPAWQQPLWTVGAHAGSANEITLTLELAPGKAVAASLHQGAVPPSTEAGPALSAAQGGEGQRLATRLSAGWAAWVLALWLGGATMILLWVAMGRLRLRLLRRAAQPPSNEALVALFHRLCEQIGVGRRVTLLQSSDNVMPVTWGWWRPVVLLPAEADEWSPDRRRVVLLHELAHVKRWDCLTQLAARVACALYWFNPLVWVAARRMCVERERACDDLVLSGGCKASDYASHLVDIARAFRRVPQVAAIAMARSSRLEERIEAIVDGSRARRSPRALLVGLCSVAVFGFIAVVAGQKSEASSSAAGANGRTWFDARLRAFVTEKAAQAHKLAGDDKVASEVWPFFEAGMKGDWQTTTNLWVAMRKRAHQYEGVKDPNPRLNKVWSPILEVDLAWETFAYGTEKYVLAYGNDIIKSISPGSVYFGGTDPGRGVVTAMSEDQVEGKPFYTLTQNALADGTYLDYLRAMYGGKIYTPTSDDSQRCFAEYLADAQRRKQEGKLKPGEDVKEKDGKVQIGGQVAVMSINGLITKVIFDRNTNEQFYVEESFPLDWMYPHLSPNGLIMKINREPLPTLSDEIVREDHEYWSAYFKPMLGDWLNYDTPVATVAAFAEKVYLKHNLRGFTGDPGFVADTWAQKAFSKLRSSIGGVYDWRATNARTPEDKERMTKEADFAFRQAFALCPTSPEAVFRYATLLVRSGRGEDARLVAKTCLKLDPENTAVKGLLKDLEQKKSK